MTNGVGFSRSKTPSIDLGRLAEFIQWAISHLGYTPRLHLLPNEN